MWIVIHSGEIDETLTQIVWTTGRKNMHFCNHVMAALSSRLEARVSNRFRFAAALVWPLCRLSRLVHSRLTPGGGYDQLFLRRKKFLLGGHQRTQTDFERGRSAGGF